MGPDLAVSGMTALEKVHRKSGRLPIDQRQPYGPRSDLNRTRLLIAFE
jgi:hypothetical protein